jgi:RHS repeat-associated protein
VNAQIAQVVGAGNYLRDVNASGTLTVADKGIANTQITKALAAPGNAAPVVNAGADQGITLPGAATLNGMASDDGLPSPPGAMTLSWTKVSGPGTVTFDSPASVATTASFDAAGTYVLRLTASDGSLIAGDDVQVTVNPAIGLNQPPVVNAGADQTITLPATASLIGTATDDGLPNPPGALTLAWSQGSGPGTATFSAPAALSTTVSFSVAGTYVLRLTANDGALSTSDDVQVTVNPAAGVNQPPVVSAGADQTVVLPASASLSGSASDDGLPNPPGAITIGWGTVSGPGTVTFGNATAAVTTASFSAAGAYVLRLTVSDGALSASDDVQVTVNPPGTVVLVPSAIDPTVATPIFESTRFIHDGPNPVQTGVVPGTIEPRRVAVLRGRVIDRGGAPLTGVVVKIHGRTQFGQTLTRGDGRYDMTVNGGEVLTIDYSGAPLLPAQRTLNAPWRDYVNVADVVMVPVDPAVTAITANGAGMQVHRGTPQTDTSGTRRATLLFPAGTGASMVLPSGATQPLTSLSVRATEYTVGSSGPAAMPGVLPATSAYTYALELSVDQALAAGAQGVQMSQPVPVYLENFLNVPAGTIVPSGYYDRGAARWIAAPNGLVIGVVALTGGVADLDVTGDGIADDPTTVLAPLGITLAERQTLATLYVAGQKLWRVPVDHFTPYDFNFAYRLPPDAEPPTVPPPRTDESVDQCMEEAPVGSIVECQNQTLGQTIGIVGTPFPLNYRSDRVPDRQSAFLLDIPASGTSVPASVKRIEVDVSIAGQRFTQSLSAAPNQRVSIAWDGRDAYQRTLQGRQAYSGSVAFVYDAEYLASVGQAAAFAVPGTTPLGGVLARRDFNLSAGFLGAIGVMDARGYAVGGWTLSNHHTYDPIAGVLYLGSGRRVSAGPIPLILNLEAGNGVTLGANGIPATQARFRLLDGLAIGADGSLYVADRLDSRVFRIDPAGIITVIAGTGVAGNAGDGGPATAAQVNNPNRIAIGPDGSLFISQSDRVRRIDPAGIITTVAGGGPVPFTVDGVLATSISVPAEGVAVAPEGSFYVLSTSGSRIFRVGTDGRITRVAGGGTIGTRTSPPNNIPARDANLTPVFGGIALDSAGNLYAGFNQFVARVDPGGMLTLVAGPVTGSSPDDGVLATEALISTPEDVAIGPDDVLYIIDSGESKVRRIGTDGRIATVVGGGTQPIVGGVQGIPGRKARVSSIRARLAPDGSLLVVDSITSLNGTRQALLRARGMPPATTGAPISVPSPDGGLLFQFDASGRHLRTLHALTGAALHEFGYDASGRLVQVMEKTGGTDNVTTIQRNANGHPAAIVAPFGQVTQLQVDGNGFVSQLVNPANETFAMTYTGGGLMRTFTAPGNRLSQYRYDTAGRLVQADDPAGGSQTIVRTDLAAGHEVLRTTILGRATKHAVDNPPSGEQKLTTVEPDTTQTLTELFEDGTQRITSADGTLATVVQGADPRFGMQAPIVQSGSTVTPGGLTRTEGATRRVVLSDPNNVLSLTTLIDTATVNSRTTTSTYTAATRAIVVTSPAGRTFTSVIDALGRVTSMQAGGLLPVAVTYDGRGRPASMAQGSGPSARTYTFAYDPHGFLQSVTDPVGRTVQYARDPAGRPTVKVLPGGAVVNVAFNAAGEVASIVPPGRPAHALLYDARGELTSITPPVVPISGPTSYAYNQDGQRTLMSQPGGESIAYTYDAAGRLTGKTLSNVASPPSAYTVAHDAAGRIANLGGPGAQAVSLAYDGAQVTGATWSGPVAGSLTRTYDTGFRLATEAVNGGPAIAFTYNADDLITQAGSLAIGRNAQNGLVQSTALGVVSDIFARNPFGEVTAYSAVANATPLYSATLTRDGLGRVTQKQETIGGVTTLLDYGYDSRGRLASVTRNGTLVESYAYDGNGNRIGTTVAGVARVASHDDQDRLLTDGAASFTYTPAGRLATRTDGGGTTSYRYDASGNLLQVLLPSGTVIGYQVDGMDRRVGKIVNGLPARRFIHDGLLPVAEFDGAGALTSRFVFAGGIAPVYMIRGGVTYGMITDSTGSVRLVVDASTGAVVQRIDYDGFGNVILDTNPGFQPFGFAGGLYDSDTRLVRFGARDYDAQAGRWTAKDPIQFGGLDTNLYAYAFNDPLNLVDPNGRLVIPLVWAGVAAGAWAAAEIALTVSDAVDFVEALLDPDVAPTEKLVSGVLLAAGAVLPGGGYGKIKDFFKKFGDKSDELCGMYVESTEEMLEQAKRMEKAFNKKGFDAHLKKTVKDVGGDPRTPFSSSGGGAGTRGGKAPTKGLKWWPTR